MTSDDNTCISETNKFKFFLITFLSVSPLLFSSRYDIKAPSLFKVRQVGKTLVNR